MTIRALTSWHARAYGEQVTAGDTLDVDAARAAVLIAQGRAEAVARAKRRKRKAASPKKDASPKKADSPEGADA